MQIPHLHQYHTLAIEERTLNLFVDRFRSPGSLAAHVQANMTPRADIEDLELAAPPQPQVWDCGGGVRVLDIVGELTKYSSSLSDCPSMIDLRMAVRKLADDPEVGGVVLRIDSPGGTVCGTEDFAHEIARCGAIKPVWAAVQDLCASAAFWCASQARRISCTESSLSGCIGTYAVIYDLSGAAEMEGIKVIVVKAGNYKGAGVPGTQVTNEQLDDMQRVIDSTNAIFIQAVSRGRGMPLQRTQELADGRIHSGNDALGLGLVDAVESLEETVGAMQQYLQAKKGGKLPSGRTMPPAISGGEGAWFLMQMNTPRGLLGAASLRSRSRGSSLAVASPTAEPTAPRLSAPPSPASPPPPQVPSGPASYMEIVKAVSSRRDDCGYCLIEARELQASDFRGARIKNELLGYEARQLTLADAMAAFDRRRTVPATLEELTAAVIEADGADAKDLRGSDARVAGNLRETLQTMVARRLDAVTAMRELEKNRGSDNPSGRVGSRRGSL